MAGDTEISRNQDGGRHDQSVQKPGWQEIRKCAETRMPGDAEVCRSRMAGDMIEVCRNQDGRRHESVQYGTRMAGDMELCRNRDWRET